MMSRYDYHYHCIKCKNHWVHRRVYATSCLDSECTQCHTLTEYQYKIIVSDQNDPDLDVTEEAKQGQVSNPCGEITVPARTRKKKKRVSIPNDPPPPYGNPKEIVWPEDLGDDPDPWTDHVREVEDLIDRSKEEEVYCAVCDGRGGVVDPCCKCGKVMGN